jgi:hypothetical protein
MYFEIIGEVADVKTIASGKGVRARKRLVKAYGKGRWRKRKGNAAVKLPNGTVRDAEVHWYEATGIGKREFQDQTFPGPGVT